jgi:hypothetical protein
MKRFLLLTGLLSSLLLGACTSAPMATAESDVKVKTFATPTNAGNLYIYRGEFIDIAPKISLFIDGVEVAQTVARSYLAVSLKPGLHQLVSKMEPESSLSLKIEAGKNYFVRQEIKSGFPSPTATLIIVDTEEGKQGVTRASLLDSPYSIAAAHPLSLGKGQDDESQIQLAPFRSGVSSYTVERLAKDHQCTGGLGASLLTEPGPIEIYRVNCEQGNVFLARCELRQCKEMAKQGN